MNNVELSFSWNRSWIEKSGIKSQKSIALWSYPFHKQITVVTRHQKMECSAEEKYEKLVVNLVFTNVLQGQAFN